MERINCSTCGKAVSTEVPDGTTVRAFIQCPECIEREAKSSTSIWRSSMWGIIIKRESDG